MKPLADVVNADELVPKVDVLVLVDGEHQALLGDLLDGAGFRDCDFDA